MSTIVDLQSRQASWRKFLEVYCVQNAFGVPDTGTLIYYACATDYSAGVSCHVARAHMLRSICVVCTGISRGERTEKAVITPDARPLTPLLWQVFCGATTASYLSLGLVKQVRCPLPL